MAVETRPGVSLLQLRELYEDHPTVPLVEAMCAQVNKIVDESDLIRAMYRVPVGRDPRKWLAEELSDDHRLLLEVGVDHWLKSPKGA